MLALAEGVPRCSPPLPLAELASPVSATWPGPGYGNKAFTGREWEPEANLYYYRARYYDPKAGRFLSEDPVGFKAGPNLYSYVLNSPTRWRDPYGYAPMNGGCCQQDFLSCLAKCIEYYDPLNLLEKTILTGTGGTIIIATAGKTGGGVPRTTIPSLVVHGARRAGMSIPGKAARVVRGIGDGMSWAFIIYGDAMAGVEIGCAIACTADACAY